MKTIRCWFFLGLSGALATLASAAGPGKAKTYVVAGYYVGAEPSPQLVAQAALQVAEKMAGMSQTDAREDADHTVEVLFKKGGFKLYVDALPLAPMISTSDIDRMRIPTSESAQPCHDPAGTSCPSRQF